MSRWGFYQRHACKIAIFNHVGSVGPAQQKLNPLFTLPHFSWTNKTLQKYVFILLASFVKEYFELNLAEIFTLSIGLSDFVRKGESLYTIKVPFRGVLQLRAFLLSQACEDRVQNWTTLSLN